MPEPDINSTDQQRCDFYEFIFSWGGMTPENEECQDLYDMDMDILRTLPGNENFDFSSCPFKNPCVVQEEEGECQCN